MNYTSHKTKPLDCRNMPYNLQQTSGQDLEKQIWFCFPEDDFFVQNATNRPFHSHEPPEPCQAKGCKSSQPSEFLISIVRLDSVTGSSTLGLQAF